MKKSLFWMYTFTLVAAGCTSAPPEKPREKKQGADSLPLPDTVENRSEGSQFHLSYPGIAYYISPDEKVDFQNFIYSDYILRNGVCVQNEPGSIDSLALVAVHRIEPGLHLVELYHLYGGGSSEQEKIFYLYRRNKNDITLTSKLYFSGGSPAMVKGKEFMLKADYYDDGDPCCCPSKTETGHFTIEQDKIVYRRSELSKTAMNFN